MRKYLLRYLIFWLPAFVVSYFFRSPATQVIQWFCAFFMLLGWSVNTGMAASRYPRHVLSLLLGYTGLNILIILALYGSHFGSARRSFLARWGGILSYGPLDIFIEAILEMDIRHELAVLAVLGGCCLAAFVIGCIYRKARPDPYHPRIRRGY